MKIFVSACLLGENCKYNGGNNYSAKVTEFIKGHEVVALCPKGYKGSIKTESRTCNFAIQKSKLWSERDLRWFIFRKENQRTGDICENVDGTGNQSDRR